MDVVLEFVILFLSWSIYGSEERPKHSIWRNIVRVIAFSGAVVFTATMLDLMAAVEFPLILSALWAICFLIVLSAEYYIGSVKVAYSAIATFVVMGMVVFSTQM